MMFRYVALLTGAAAMVAGGCSHSGSARAVSIPSASSERPHQYPNSIVVIGHSGATGLHSDPAAPNTDAKQNSWATGDNPAVDSIYTRLVAVNPQARRHNVNAAVDNTGVNELSGQIDQALALEPNPDLFLIETVDNDVRCDGTDAQNIDPFTAALRAVLTKISTLAPQAKVLIVSSPWSTTEAYFNIAQQLPGARQSNTGSGVCDLFTPSGEPVPANQANLEQIAQQYLAAVNATCATFPSCRYDNGALHNIMFTADDVTPEGFHLTVSGQHKVAEAEWNVLAL